MGAAGNYIVRKETAIMNEPMNEPGLAGKRILFIGAGNMAEALVRGVLGAGVSRPRSIRVSDVDGARVAYFRERYGVAGSGDNPEEAGNADIVVLAVKPQAIADVLGGIRGKLREDALVVSVAAGITTRAIESMLGSGARVVRVMPNSPASVGRGAAAFACGNRAGEDDARTVATLFQAVGIVARVEESALDVVTALSGSGPAYVFYLVESMIKAGVEMGLRPDIARALTVATVEGAARMLAETGLDPRELRRRVTSEGGTTAAALDVLRNARVQERFVEAMLAAEKRSRELSATQHCADEGTRG